MARFLSEEFEPAADDDEYIGAILDVLLDSLEPNPRDRPSASELLSYSIFSLVEEDQDEQSDETPTVSSSPIFPPTPPSSWDPLDEPKTHMPFNEEVLNKNDASSIS